MVTADKRLGIGGPLGVAMLCAGNMLAELYARTIRIPLNCRHHRHFIADNPHHLAFAVLVASQVWRPLQYIHHTLSQQESCTRSGCTGLLHKVHRHINELLTGHYTDRLFITRQQVNTKQLSKQRAEQLDQSYCSGERAIWNSFYRLLGQQSLDSKNFKVKSNPIQSLLSDNKVHTIVKIEKIEDRQKQRLTYNNTTHRKLTTIYIYMRI